jgi:hypothetical protein
VGGVRRDAPDAHGWETLEVDPAGVQQLRAALGHEPVVVDIGEFAKLEGCVTCLSIRLRELYVRGALRACIRPRDLRVPGPSRVRCGDSADQGPLRCV